MSELTTRAAAAPYALTIRRILEHPVVDDPSQEIVYRDLRRHTYADLRERVHRLAGALAALGVKPGDTVAVMDYDSHRYLEAFFAVPMMGAVLHTINVRLSPEQILYTIEHAEDDVLLVHADFLPILEAIRGRIDVVKSFVLLTDDGAPPAAAIPFAGEYEALLAAAPARFAFPDVDEDARATTFYTTGTTGLPKGVFFTPPPARAAHPVASRRCSARPTTRRSGAATCTCRSRRCSTSTRGACRTSRRCSA